MAAIDDLIDQVEDKALRERLRIEASRITKTKKFGLVFEEHLPELTPIYNAKVRTRCKVALRDSSLTDLWRVLSIGGAKAKCRNIATGETQQIPTGDLVVVRQFGEPIFPALAPVDKVQNGADDAPWHTLIEADNYHALQLLQYLYAGKVDCIYIDPPYNTGARDWKYNNDFVDKNDRWRHSKWLAMMRRRLLLCLSLLKHDGIMVITIDDYEVHHIRALLADPEMRLHTLGVVAIKNNPSGRGTVSGFAVSHEYAVFVSKSEDAVVGRLDRTAKQLARYKEVDDIGAFEWANFRKHGGPTSYRKERPRSFYPIYVNGRNIRIPKMEWLEIERAWKILDKPTRSEEVILPIDADGAERVWALTHKTARNSLDELEVRPDQEGKTGIYRKWRLNEPKALPSSWWENNIYSSAEHGTNFLKNVFGETQRFTFPKSIYAVRDCLLVAGCDAPNALVLDFFAGSGTTLNAVNLLNCMDGGDRRCILVTNNEVSDDDAKLLAESGLRPGEAEWEQRGICQAVTWPRSHTTITGVRHGGAVLDNSYLSGITKTVEKGRSFSQIGFTTIDDLNTTAKKKQLVALIDAIPQSAVKRDSVFVVTDKHHASILFDDEQADAWMDALEDQDHISDFYIVTSSNATFETIKARVADLLGTVSVTEEENRPMRDGFPANLEYFRLEFLEKNELALGRQFGEILPLLWLRAGAVGPRPKLPKNKRLPTMLIPKENRFAVLIDDIQFADFATHLEGRDDLTHVFLVTDSEEAFQEMAAQIDVPNVVQLYRDYLENFVINKGGIAR